MMTQLERVFVLCLALGWAAVSAFGQTVAATDTFQLAKPIVRYPSVFFKKKATATALFDQPNTKLHYTLNGQLPTERDPVYRAPLRIAAPYTSLAVRAFGTGFHPSEATQVTFIEAGLPYTVRTATTPHPRYAGNGTSILHDAQDGRMDFSQPTWLGYASDSVVFDIQLQRPQRVQAVVLHALQNDGAWIFLPQRIQIQAHDDRGQMVATANKNYPAPNAPKAAEVLPLRIELPAKNRVKTMRITVFPLAQMPNWHAGHGQRAWFFLDELIVHK